MANKAQLITQIRFEIEQLSAKNGQHDFEHICRFITRARICSNILPATGPVSGGGDQGRDYETFRTYLDSNIIGASSFIGLVKEGPVVFACTLTEKKNLKAKIQSDIEKIKGSGQPVIDIHYFCGEDVNVAARHELISWAQSQHQAKLEIHDGQAISEYLSDEDTFWIAEQYLQMPSELFPSVPSDAEEWYAEVLSVWRGMADPPTNYADFVALKSALRHATDHARQDLLFWISKMDMLIQHTPSERLRHLAVYEIAVARLMGLGTLIGYEQPLRDYFSTIEAIDDAFDLEDVKNLWSFVVGAFHRSLVGLAEAEIQKWGSQFIALIDKMLASSPQPSKRCVLLYNKGYMTLMSLTSKQPNVSGALSCWLELASIAKDALLFPLERFSDSLTALVSLPTDVLSLDQNADFRRLTMMVDDLLSERHGGFIAAEKCRDRAIAFFKRKEYSRAIAEIHDAKIKWYAEETIRQSALSALFIADCYSNLGLIFAAKYYAFTGAFMLLRDTDESLKKYVPRALTNAASYDYLEGAFCGFLDLSDVAVRSFAAFGGGAAPSDDSRVIEEILTSCAYVHFFSTTLVPEFLNHLDKRIASWPELKPMYDEMTAEAKAAWDKSFLPTFWQTLEEQMVDTPFNDLQIKRTVRFEALGINWEFSWNNEYNLTAAAEEFLASLQILLADFANTDLCLMRTSITAELVLNRQGDASAKRLPSNNSSPWTIYLPSDDIVENTGLIAAYVTILNDASLLPRDSFLKHLERVFKDGLSSKVLFVQRYRVLYSKFVDKESFDFWPRGKVTPKLGHDFRPTNSSHLAWLSGPGPGYSKEGMKETLHKRYANSIKPIKLTLPRLLKEESFRKTIASLKSDGWLDWHILTAIGSAAINYRVRSKIPVVNSESDMAEIGHLYMELANRDETEHDLFVPLDEFCDDKLRLMLKVSMGSTVKAYGLEAHQNTPDNKAISDFLGQRYGYWAEDVEHPSYGL